MTYFKIAGGGAALIAAAFTAQIALPEALQTTYERTGGEIVRTAEPKDDRSYDDLRPVQTHVPLPGAVKAVYMTSCVAGTPSFRNSVISLIDETEINSVVIDIKDFSGTISFAPTSPAWMPAWDAARCGARDMDALIDELHAKGIYVIGRITVFQDPFYTARHPELAVKRASDGSVWKDHKGLSFIDVGARPYWDHIIELAVDSYNLGFDELNFDYVRYPSDGNMEDIAFTHSSGKTKPENLETFFKYLHEKLSEPERYAQMRHENTGREHAIPYLSADLFGMTTSNTDDLSIGQVQERAIPYFDFIAPMVYPSHYPHGFMGLGNPNHYPYEVIKYAMGEGVRRLRATTTSVDAYTHTRIGTSTPPVYAKPSDDIQKLRPWLQDFDYGGEYGVEEVRAQIQATYDVGLTSWMIWDPGNRYTRAAYLPE
jgi:hypothetical protein